MKIVIKIIVLIALLIGIYILLPQQYKMFIRHGFSNADDYKIFDNRSIKHGNVEQWIHHPMYNKLNFNTKEEQKHADLNTKAFLVIKDGQILHEKYYAGYDSLTLHASFSMAKSIVSLLIGIAEGEGMISSINDPVKKYLPALNYEGNNDVTIADVLMMSSGMEWNEDYFNPLAPPFKAYYGNDINAMMNDTKFDTVGGKTWIYQSGSTQLLGMILEKVTGTNLSQYMQDKIWKYIGAESDALWSLDHKDGHEKAFCCFNSTASDYIRLGQLILNKGQWNNRQIVPEAYLTRATSANLQLKNNKGQVCDWYGYQFWILNRSGMKIPYMRGFKGQFMYIIPERNAVVLRLGEKVYNRTDDHLSPDIDAFFDMGLRIIEESEKQMVHAK